MSAKSPENTGAAAHLTHPEATRDHVSADPSTTVAHATSTPDESLVPTHAGGLPLIPGYAVSGEIARGGMGRLLAARDLTLDREVAVKVLLGEPSPAAIARFETESKVTARLQHPGIPPVHQLGTLPDGSPFLAMKLIRGRTLAAILASHERERPELLAIFEQICHAVGFSHSQGVIHRDLKPANVMVGEFSEVQVMDWGLARGVVSGQWTVDSQSEASSSLSTNHSPLTTTPGQVLGTPSYMAPEQARGEAVDQRADVFALGGILCAILTGQATFTGASTAEVLRKASRGDVDATINRLDASGADAELVALCKRCLSPKAEDRPADGKAVADAVLAYRTGVEERLQTAERNRAAAEAREAEGRRRRRWQLTAAAAALVIVGGGLGFALWRERAKIRDAELRAEKAAADAANAAKAREGVPLLLALSADLRKQLRFREAGEPLDRATALLAGGVADELKPQVEQAKEDLAFAVLLDDIRYKKWVLIAEAGGRGFFHSTSAPPAYRKAFLARGIELAGTPVADLVHRINSSGIRTELIDALDDWAVYEKDQQLVSRLLEVLRTADPGPWTDRLRDPTVRADKSRLAELRDTVDLSTTPPGQIVTLTELLGQQGLVSIQFVTRAQLRRPNDFQLAFNFGRWLQIGAEANPRGTPSDALARAAGAFAAARALRPDSLPATTNLAEVLNEAGDLGSAEDANRAAIALDPTFAATHNNLAVVLDGMGRVAEAATALREAIRLDPTGARFHNNLGVMLMKLKEPDAAIVSFREAIRLLPGYALAHSNLGVALHMTGDLEGAFKACREAVHLDTDLAIAHSNFAVILQAVGKPDGAIVASKEAIRLNPRLGTAYYNLATAYVELREYDAAIAAATEAIRLEPKDANNQYVLGMGHFRKQDYGAAAAAFSEVIRLTPRDGRGYNSLGATLMRLGDHPEAKKCYEKALALAPDSALVHSNLGHVLHVIGELKDAEYHLRKAAEIDTKRYGHLLARFPLKNIAPPPREVNR